MLKVDEIKNTLECSNDVAEFILNNQGRILNMVNSPYNESDYFCNQWSIDDIKQKDQDTIEDGSDCLKPLTDDELQQCRTQILHGIDCNYGLTWDSLEYAIETVKDDRIKNIMKDINSKYKFIGNCADFGNSTWRIKDNTILFATEENNIYEICTYKYNEPTEDLNMTFNILFSGTIEECIDYIKDSID